MFWLETRDNWCFIYKELVKEEEPIEIVFVSGDDNQEEMKTFMKDHHGDWLAIQQGTALAK